jgi:hypothetical protein
MAVAPPRTRVEIRPEREAHAALGTASCMYQVCGEQANDHSYRLRASAPGFDFDHAVIAPPFGIRFDPGTLRFCDPCGEAFMASDPTVLTVEIA